MVTHYKEKTVVRIVKCGSCALSFLLISLYQNLGGYF